MSRRASTTRIGMPLSPQVMQPERVSQLGTVIRSRSRAAPPAAGTRRPCVGADPRWPVPPPDPPWKERTRRGSEPRPPASPPAVVIGEEPDIDVPSYAYDVNFGDLIGRVHELDHLPRYRQAHMSLPRRPGAAITDTLPVWCSYTTWHEALPGAGSGITILFARIFPGSADPCGRPRNDPGALSPERAARRLARR